MHTLVDATFALLVEGADLEKVDKAWNELCREPSIVDGRPAPAAAPDPETWGILPEHIAEQDRLMSGLKAPAGRR